MVHGPLSAPLCHPLRAFVVKFSFFPLRLSLKKGVSKWDTFLNPANIIKIIYLITILLVDFVPLASTTSKYIPFSSWELIFTVPEVSKLLL